MPLPLGTKEVQIIKNESGAGHLNFTAVWNMSITIVRCNKLKEKNHQVEAV